MKDLITTQELVFSSFKMSKNGLEAVGEPTFDEWLKAGEFLTNANGAVHFWIGYWLNYGEHKFGETYAQAIDETGYSYGTLANDKWVASRVDQSRRREGLTFSHHQEIADLMPEDQEKMLDLAQEHKLNSKGFRNEVRAYKMQLDLPELTDEDRNRVTPQDFEKAQYFVGALIDLVDEIESIDYTAFDPDAHAFIVSQLKKAIGKMGRLISK